MTKRSPQEELIRRKIKAAQTLYSINNSRMAAKLMMSQRSFERRLTNPSEFSLGELLQMEKILHLGLLSI